MVSNVSMKLFASSYSPGTQVSTTNNTTDRHDITEILLKEVLNTINLTPINLLHVYFQCFLDGPFGTSSREALNTEHAILIGAGIGVTPMASILQSILHRIKQSKRKCPECSHCWYDETPENIAKMKKVLSLLLSFLK